MKTVKDILIQVYEFYYEKKRIFTLRTKYRLRIMNYERTLKYILKNKCSIARFGDGEFDHILDIKDEGFQERSNELKNELAAVLDCHNSNLLLCIPYCMNSIKGCNKHSGDFWITWGKRGNHHQEIVNMIRSHTGKDYIFGDSQITRPYIDWKTNKRAKKSFFLLKCLWEDRNIIIVEGSQTRMGIGNDLYNNAKSIKRILCPAENAFNKIDAIEEEILKHYNGELILLALGPTATILAKRFALKNIQALDLGNLDIEYEWFLSNSTERVTIEGKYTNESVTKDGRVPSECDDPIYLSQIIARIE